MGKNMLLMTLALLLAVSLAGCKTVAPTEGAAPGVKVNDPNAPYATIRMNTVNIIDKSLQVGAAGKIAVEQTNARRTATNTLEVFAVLRNRTDYPLQVEGSTQFFDANQAPVEGPTAWQRVHLPPNGVATYKEMSLRNDSSIAYYYVEIREGR